MPVKSSHVLALATDFDLDMDFWEAPLLVLFQRTIRTSSREQMLRKMDPL